MLQQERTRRGVLGYRNPVKLIPPLVSWNITRPWRNIS